VQADENGAPGAWAFTIFNYNWWMVKQSCPEYTPAGYTTSSGEAQIPPEILDVLKCLPPSCFPPFVLTSSDTPLSPPCCFTAIDTPSNNQTAATICLHQMMNDPFYNLPSGPPPSADYPSPAWWATQRGGPNAGIAYVAGGAMGKVERDYMWNTPGIRDWILRGGHLVDDWIESSCLSGMSLFLFCIFARGFGFLGGGGDVECRG